MISEIERRGLSELSKYKDKSISSIKLKFVKNWILERLATSFPIPSWRTKLHKKRGVIIGKGVYIGYDVIFDRMFPELISIGDNTSIGDKSIITVHANIPSNTLLRQVYPRETNPVKIGKNVWMMPHVIIIPGITIGDYSVIATGAVVVKDIPPMTLAVGVPAKPVKDLSDKIRKYIPKIEYEELLKKRKKFFGELFPKKSNVHN